MAEVTNESSETTEEVYAGPEELSEAKRLLESVFDSLGGLLQGRIMSAIDDIAFVMDGFMVPKSDLDDGDDETEH